MGSVNPENKSQKVAQARQKQKQNLEFLTKFFTKN
jgi:hypothetical protein